MLLGDRVGEPSDRHGVRQHRRRQRSAYSTAKAGLLGLTRSLAREFGPYGICVNTVLPGAIEVEADVRVVHHWAIRPRRRWLAASFRRPHRPRVQRRGTCRMRTGGDPVDRGGARRHRPQAREDRLPPAWCRLRAGGGAHTGPPLSAT
ncbi:SDR family oxidoreductase [Streptomyces sp. NPDC058289]|uniref:SDR family oxidoreductase n=1 Tax=Streptomyces sp. NPDC058289 TaxID=3346425 RepID=UPI0036EB3D78